MIYALAKRDPRIVFIGSDLTPGLLAEMKRDMPDRYYMEGIAEANVVGMAAGMAMDGKIPFVNTIATFITRRCYEQVALDLCLHNLPVRLVGNGGGLVYAPLGPTHLAVEDIAIMRALPNMTIVAAADAPEMVRFMRAAVDWPGPIYIRLGKGGDPVISSDANGFEIGKGIVMRASHAPDKVLLVSTGVMTARSLDAAELLADRDIDCEVFHLHTIKPLDEAQLLRRAAGARAIFTIEEHTVVGGLGSAVIECLVEKATSPLPMMRKLGLPDRFAENYGRQDDLLELAGLQPAQIAKTVETVLRPLEVA